MSIYQELAADEFRLISFVDTASGTACKLDTYKLNQAPLCIALSYTWGDALHSLGRPACEKYTISVNGQLFEIQQNLHDGLGRLAARAKQNEGFLWVDTICINQKDNAEKSKQVRQMREIYENANTVFAWLGPSKDAAGIEAAIKLMQSIYDDRELSSEDHWPRSLIPDKHWALPQDDFGPLWQAWRGVQDIVDRPYWNRLWIHQEASVPGTVSVLCGDYSFDILQLFAAQKFVYAVRASSGVPLKMTVQPSIKEIEYRRLWRRMSSRSDSLLDLVTSMRSLRCTDARDKIFAALAFVPSGSLAAIDYDWNLLTTYIEAARMIMSELDQNALELLALTCMAPGTGRNPAELRRSAKEALPTWVSDWQYTRRVCQFSWPWIALTRRPGESVYDPCPGTTTDVCIYDKELELTAQVLRKLDIEYLTDVMWEEGDWLAMLESWYDDLRLYRSLDSEQAIRRTFAADKVMTYNGGEISDGGRGCMLDSNLIRKHAGNLDTDKRRAWVDMRTSVDFTCVNNRMARLSRGRVALLPGAAGLGDRIAAFHGGGCLYVVRPVPAREDA